MLSRVVAIASSMPVCSTKTARLGSAPKARLLPLALLLLGCVSAAPSHAQAIAAPSAPPTPAIVDASAPIARTDKPAFYTLHDEFLARGKSGPIGVLFLGDSITERWKQAPHIWEHYFGKYQSANFGIGGDRTHNVIWRIENGEHLLLTRKLELPFKAPVNPPPAVSATYDADNRLEGRGGDACGRAITVPAERSGAKPREVEAPRPFDFAPAALRSGRTASGCRNG